jgi:glycosyltransferase involved in cell wall biosynthesis
MFPKRPCHILHNPFNAAVIDHVPKGLDQKKYVAWIGVFSAQKNMQLLCNVAKAQTKMQFRIAGMPSKSIDAETKSILAELDALKNVKFIGYVKRKNILSFLSNAYCLLNTSSYEGFSNTFLEAFAAGTPVLCPSRVDPDGLVADNRLGYTAENDLELVDLLIKIRSLTADAFKRLSVRCRSYVLTAHNPETQAGKLIDYLTPLIDAKAQ